MRTVVFVTAFLVTALIASTLAGCSESPRTGFEDFYAAMAAQEPRVLERLSARTRAQVEATAAAQGVDAASALTAGGVRSTLRAVRVKEQEGDRALLEVEDALGQTDTVHMVKEEGRWRVDLGEAP